MAPPRKVLGAALPLQAFVRRQQVLRLFRALQRGAKDLEDQSLAMHVREQIRFEFRNNSNLKDNVTLRNLIKDGQRQLTKLLSMGKKAAISSTSSSSSLQQDGWLGSGGDGSGVVGGQDEGDKRGRVGTGWPWQ